MEILLKAQCRKANHFIIGIILCGILILNTKIAVADAPPWDFNLPHAGRVLYEGGWFQEYQLGVINASPEFNFPLQLVYLSTRESSGMFGPQWFCPQLESTVIPQGVGGFTWQTPAGNVLPFRKSSTTDSSLYSDFSGSWQAKAAPDHQEIRNQAGWTYAYERGRLKTLTSPTGRVLQFTWNGSDFQGLQIVDPVSGQARELMQASYASEPHNISGLGYNGIIQGFTYEDKHDGRLNSWTLPSKERVCFGYADTGVLAQIQRNQDPIQNFTTWLRDLNSDTSTDKNDPANWYLVQDPDNKYTYAATGKKDALLLPNKVSIVSNSGLTQTIDYNPMGGVTVQNTGKDDTQTTTYYRAPGKSFDGKLKSVQDNGVLLAEYDYDPKTGYLSSITDNNGITTYFDYPLDWKKSSKNPWDPKPIRVWRGTKDNPEVISQYWYDDAGRVICTQDAANQVTKFNYTPRGELGSVIAPDGITSTMTYDAFARCVQSTTGNQTEAVEYDEQGHVKSRTSPDGSKIQYTYDEMGNVTEVSQNGKPVIDYIRDAKGRLMGEKDSLGRIRKIDSDANGNVLAEYAPDGSVTKYEYDKLNRRTAQIDGNGNKISFEFDPGNHMTKQVNPLGDTTNWTYDDQSQLIAMDNGVQKIKYTYDENGRMTSIDYGAADQKITYTYDDHGRVLSEVTPSTVFYHVYNQLGQLDATRAICGQDEQLIRYFYNSAGQRTGLILARLVPAVAPAGGKIGHDAQYEILQQTEYTYENRRLSAIKSNGKPVISYKYDTNGRPILKTYGNGVQNTITYDTNGRLSKMIFAGGPLPAPLTLAYTWDSADQVTQRSWNGETLHYDYDAGGHLAKVTQVIDEKTFQALETYVYDKAGNMTQKTLQGEKSVSTYNAANELTSVTGPQGTVSYTYDKAGRLLSSSGGPTTTYGWLNKATQITGGPGGQVELTYWPDGQLATKGPAGSLTKTAFTPGQPEAEHFLWDGLALLRRNDTIYIVEPHPSGGVVIASHVINDLQNNIYLLNDMLGTTLAIMKNQQIEFNALTSFGQPRRQVQAAAQPSTLQAPTPSAPLSQPQPQLPPTPQ